MHTTSKRIELEGPGCSGFQARQTFTLTLTQTVNVAKQVHKGCVHTYTTSK